MQHFKLKFKQPKKEQCDTCTSYENIPDLLTNEMKTSQTKHLNEKNLARQNKNLKLKAANDESILAAVFDFQKTLLCVLGQTFSFYGRRLRSYNLKLDLKFKVA